MSDDYQAALAAAMRRLHASDRFESEVRKALSRYPAETVDRVVAYLREQRMLNDERTAETLVEFNGGRRAVGAARMRTTLERRGAPEDLVEQVASATAEGDDERADTLLAAKFEARELKDRAKAGRFLYGRGFGEETIEGALERHFGSGDQDF